MTVSLRNLTLLSTFLSFLTLTGFSGGYNTGNAEFGAIVGVIFESKQEAINTTMRSTSSNISDRGSSNINPRVSNLPDAVPSQPDTLQSGKTFKIAHPEPTNKYGCHADSRGVWHCH